MDEEEEGPEHGGIPRGPSCLIRLRLAHSSLLLFPFLQSEAPLQRALSRDSPYAHIVFPGKEGSGRVGGTVVMKILQDCEKDAGDRYCSRRLASISVVRCTFFSICSRLLVYTL